MTVRLDIDWVRDYAERRLSPPERVVFEARLRAEPELAELVDQFAEVSTWPAENVEASAVRFEDLALDDRTPVLLGPRRLPVRSLAIAAGIVLAVTGGLFVLTRRGATTSSPAGPVALTAIHRGQGDGMTAATHAVTPLAETYLPVVDRELRFVEGFRDALDVARVAGRPAFVFVHLEGCPACAEMESSTFRDERLLAIAPQFVFAKVSANVVGSSLEIPSELGLGAVKAWPMFAIFDSVGARVDAFGGMLSAEKLVARLTRALGAKAAEVPDWARVHDAARTARLELEARHTLAAVETLVATGTIEAAIAELDQAIVRLAGSPFADDLRRVRDRVASDRKFPALEYAR